MIYLDGSAIPQLFHDLGLVFSYLLLGMSLKYIDQAFDIGVFNRKVATALAVPTAVLMGVLMVLDAPSASIFMAVALGVAAAQKIDNIAFQIGIGLLILIPVFFSNIIELLWIPFGILFIAALADEFGNDWSDEYDKNKQIKKIKNPPREHELLYYFFNHRSTMKVTILTLIIFQQLHPVYLPAFLLFDLGYRITEEISWNLKPYKLKNPTKNNNKKHQKTTLST
ncbi:MAG: hypothetical protein GF414_00830 [Candidatus Altiarchaeales archaeon]|nr:hypothetical protein [Candidatus Altiarchaeales archaeon]